MNCPLSLALWVRVESGYHVWRMEQDILTCLDIEGSKMDEKRVPGDSWPFVVDVLQLTHDEA